MVLKIKPVPVLPYQLPFFVEKYEVKNGRKHLAFIYKRTNISTDSKGRIGAFNLEINKTISVLSASLEMTKNDLLAFAVGYYQNENVSIE